MSAPLKQRIMELLGWTLVPEGHLCLVMRDGRPHRFVGPGYVKCARWTETLGPIIDVGFRIYPFAFTNVRSLEGICLQVQGRVAFRFDPRQARAGMELSVAYSIGRQPNLLETIVHDRTEQATREALGRFTTRVLCDGGNLKSFQHQIERKLDEKIRHLGFRLVQPEAIVLTGIFPPSEFESALLLESLPSEVREWLRQKAILETIVNNNATIVWLTNSDTLNGLLGRGGDPNPPILKL